MRALTGLLVLFLPGAHAACRLICEDGEYKHGQCSYGTDCRECPTGWYQRDAGGWPTSCKQCGGGQFQDRWGQDKCLSCPVGQYQNQGLQAECKGCLGGKYQDEEGQTFCKQCGSGQYQGVEGQHKCLSCPSGKYQNQHLQAECKECPGGRFGPERAESSLACDRIKCPGACTHTDWSVYCSPGFYLTEDVGTVTTQSCTACPSGLYQEADTHRKTKCYTKAPPAEDAPEGVNAWVVVVPLLLVAICLGIVVWKLKPCKGKGLPRKGNELAYIKPRPLTSP